MNPTTTSVTCEACRDSGWVSGLNGVRPCTCRAAIADRNRIAAANLPPRYARCTLESYQPAGLTQMAAHRKCKTVVDQYPEADMGVLLLGPVGVGKTHLACAILNALLKKGAAGVFYELGSLLNEIRTSYDPTTNMSESGILAPVFMADVLVLDEIGATRPTAWVHDMMMHIINTRYNQMRLTILTSNYNDIAGGRIQSLQERVGARIRSRLYEMCHTVNIDGPDYRQRNAT